MEEKHSILEDISVKEAELKNVCDQVCRKAEDIVHNARAQAAQIIEDAEQTGKNEAAEVYDQEISLLKREIEEIERKGREKLNVTLKTGENNLEKAAQLLISEVLR